MKASIKAVSKICKKVLSKTLQLEHKENKEINHAWVANMALMK